jgi:NTE family protein
LSSGVPQPNQVVTLAFLSEHIPASLICEQLAGSLCAETKATVVLVRFIFLNGNGATNDGLQPDVSLNGEFHMPPNVRQAEAGYCSIIVGVDSEPPSPAGIASLVSQLSALFDYVLIGAPANERSAPWLSECLVCSDLTYLLLRADNEDIKHHAELMREVSFRSANVKPIGCLAEGERTDNFDTFVHRNVGPVHMFVRGYPTHKLFRADVRRLARDVSGRLVGLALSSGAAKGFAHIGVIQVLEENGIEIDVIAGSSMGAYVGCLWAYGCEGPELERLAREMEGRWPLWTLIDPVFPPRQGFLRGHAVKKRLMRSIGNACFADLVRPMRIVAGNLATLERVVFSSGEVAAAVHASSAVPGICVPVTIDGETYIDGGIVDPLPVDVLREMGVSRVIGVDVIPTPDRIRAGLNAGREPARVSENGPRKLFRKLLPVNQQLNYFARGNLLEILMRSIYGAQIRVAAATARMADLVLRPNICDDRWLDYRHPSKFIALGREAATKHLEEIKALVASGETSPANKELNHEPERTPETVATTA